MGAMQDIGTASGPSNSLGKSGLPLSAWRTVGGGEAGFVVPDRAEPEIVYAGEYGGYISLYDERTRQARNVGIYPENASGHGAEDLKYRFQWTAPIATSPHDPKVLYHGANVLFRSTDRGQNWTAISPDLTRNDRSKQHWSGGPITGDNTGVEIYNTIFAVAESPKEASVIWVGSDDGLVHVTRDGGKSWTNVTKNIPGIPQWATVDMIEPSPFEAGTAYLVADAHRLDDVRPYLWKTSDYGKRWTSLSARLAPDVYLHSVREDPARRGLLYLGTERGVAYSVDGGNAWQPVKLRLPTVAVSDIVVKGNDLVLSTMGRSLWIFDDLTPIREMSPAVLQADAYLFPAAPAIRWRREPVDSALGDGRNPPKGAIINYYLKKKPQGEIRIEIVDAKGKPVRTLKSAPEPVEYGPDDPDEPTEPPTPAVPSDSGVQRAVWDLAYTGATTIKHAKIDAGSPKEGPLVLPGIYTAKLVVEGKSYTTEITVNPDPRVRVTQPELAQQLEFSLQVRDAISRLAGVVEAVRSVRQQLSARAAVWKAEPKAASLVATAQALMVKLDSLESKLHNPGAEVVYDILAQRGGAKLYSRLAPLYTWASEADGPPTQAMWEVYADQLKELDALEGEFNGLVAKELAAVNAMAKELNVADVAVPPTAPQ